MTARPVSLGVFALLVAAAAYTGSRFQPGIWYAELAKPAWTPPGWVFPPVWTLLYIAIAVAGWLVWTGSGTRRGAALGAWGVQLVANAAWSWLFFELHRVGLALLDIGVMLAAILGFILLTWSMRRVAAVLFIPYALWVLYAGALNLAIWRLAG